MSSGISSPKPGFGGRPREVGMRRAVDAVFYLNRTGCAWRMLPKDFGPWSSVYHDFRLFRDDGTWERVQNKLRLAGPAPLFEQRL